MRGWGRERERERERETESEAGSRLWAFSTEHDTGLELMDHEIMTWAEVGHLTYWATQVHPKVYFLLVLSPNVSQLTLQSSCPPCYDIQIQAICTLQLHHLNAYSSLCHGRRKESQRVAHWLLNASAQEWLLFMAHWAHGSTWIFSE